MNDKPRLIEHAFPLKQASLDSVHEKNVRHGHISTLHIWPARRPLAACRAALIATLLPDPGDPKVLDPFAGGGAIPLEAMRLGCEATAADINPVAWFILKCTLEYPQKLAGQKRPLPDFILKDREFMEAFFKAQGLKGAMLRTQLEKLGLGKNDQPILKNFHEGIGTLVIK